MKDKFTFAITLIGISAGTVSFTYGTFVTKDYLTEAVLRRLDRIEGKLDQLIQSQDHLENQTPSTAQKIQSKDQ